MLTKTASYLSDFFILIFVFSFFNDKFMVNHFGEISLKILFFLFLILYFFSILRNFKTMTATQDKLFFTFFITNTTIFLLQIIFIPMNNILTSALLLISNFSIVIYFSRYPIQKLLYFIWVSIIISVIIGYFNSPVSEWTFRKSGGTEDPNEFATQLLAFLFASFYLYTHNKNKIFLTMSILFFTYGIFHAGSMSSFLMLGFVSAFAIIRLLIMDLKLFLNYKVFLGLIILLTMSSQIDLVKLESVTNVLNRTKNTGTAEFRMHSWKAGQHMIEENFFLGIGLNEFSYNTAKYEEGYMRGSAPAPHNIYIKLFAESGVLTFVLFILFIGYILTLNYKKIFYSNDWLIASMLVSALLMGITLGITYDKYFWLYIAIMMSLNHQLSRRKLNS